MDCSLPGSSLHGILQARVLESGAITFSDTALMYSFYAGQEATVRTGHGTTDWFQIGKGVHQAVHCHPAHLTYLRSTS